MPLFALSPWMVRSCQWSPSTHMAESHLWEHGCYGKFISLEGCTQNLKASENDEGNKRQLDCTWDRRVGPMRESRLRYAMLTARDTSAALVLPTIAPCTRPHGPVHSQYRLRAPMGPWPSSQERHADNPGSVVVDSTQLSSRKQGITCHTSRRTSHLQGR